MIGKKYGVVSPEVMKSYDGLGFLKAIVDGTLPNPPMSEVLGFHLIEVENGRAVFSTLVKGDAWTTLELKFNLVRPMTKDTGPVRAEGRIIHRGRTVATSEGDLKDRAGKLYAHATTTTMIFPAKG